MPGNQWIITRKNIATKAGYLIEGPTFLPVSTQFPNSAIILFLQCSSWSQNL